MFNKINVFRHLVALTIGICFTNCSNTQTGSVKERVLLAKDTIDNIGLPVFTFEVFADSLFTYSTFCDYFGDIASGVHSGKLRISNDSLIFNSEISFNGVSLAVLKNGYVEFVKGEYPFRIKIQNTSLPVSNFVNYEKYSDYAFFNDKRIPKSEYLEITNAEVALIDSLGKLYFKSYGPLLYPFEDYLKQVVVSREPNGEITFGISCFCKSTELRSEFRQRLIDMSDGGNCNVSFVVDFKAKTCDYLIVAGEA